MILDLTNVPFTRRNSYMVISYITDQFRLFGRKIAEDEGLYLRSVRGDCRMNPLIAHLVPTYQGKAADYTYYSDGTEIVVELKAADAKIEIIFAEENTLLIRGQGEGIGLEFDRLAGSESLYDYVITIPYKEREFYEANLFRNASKYIFGSRKGKKSFAQDWQEQTAKACKIIYEAVDGEFEATVEEAQVEWKFREYTFSFDEKLAEVKKEFAEFCNTMPEVPDEYEEEKKLAVKSFDHWHEYNLVQKPEMGDLVRDLKAKGYGIYLCSNASVRMLTCYKEVLPAVECFDGILFSAEVLCMKPQKEMYGHFFERFGLKPEECYFIDDLPNNIAGAKACGMDGYCFADGDVEKLKRTLYESVLS